MKKHVPNSSKQNKGKQRKHRPVVADSASTKPLRSRIQRTVRKKRTGGIK